MKFTEVLLLLGMITLLACTVIYAIGVEKGEYVQRNRIYIKCLKEHETLPHKDAVSLCEERVK
jgi:hypothetical protein